VGATIDAPRLGGTPWGVGGEGLISIRNYRHLLLRAGRLDARHALPAIRPADSSITSMMGEGRQQAAGLSWSIEQRWRSLPSLSFFGRDGAGQARTDYGLSRTTTDAVVQWRGAGRPIGISGRIGLMQTSTFPGTNADRPDTVDRFGPALEARRFGTTRYVTLGGGALVDHRADAARATDGWLAQVVVNGYRGLSADAPSFVRAAIDARVSRGIGPPRHVLAGRLLASVDATGRGQRVPYYLQQTLGGASSLRGYTSYRLRGERLVHATVESRWQIHHRLDIVPFVDAGAAGRSPIDQGLHGVIVSPGIGLRVKRKGRSIGRLDLAHGREGTRISLDVGDPF
jgi:hypothetical protein